MQYTTREVYEYISKQTNDPIVEWKTCLVSSQPFPIYQSDLDFYKKISPTFDGQTFPIPTPTLCPEERQRRRLSFRNERKLYKRKCDASGKDIISIYSPDKPIKVYENKTRRSDAWDPMEYGINYNSQQSVIKQIQLLAKAIPQDALTKEFMKQENSDYTNSSGPCKDCYMVFETAFCEDVYFSEHIFQSKDSIDSSYIADSTQCYQCVDCYTCQQVRYCLQCTECSQSAFLYNCSSCFACMFCTNLTNKQYCIFNKQYSKEEYQTIVADLANKKMSELSADFYTLLADPALIRANMQGVQNEAVYGANTTKSKRAVCVHDSYDLQDCKYSSMLNMSQDCYDMDSRGENASLCYEVQESGRNISNIAFSWLVWENCKHLYYCMYCISCSDCFGCVGLHNKQYCIFNKQYTKETYEQELKKIIGHMITTGERGEFFHPSLSPFGYNETVAQEYFPLTKDSPFLQGENSALTSNSGLYKRSDYNADPKIPEGTPTLTGDQIPTDIATVTDDILTKIFVCEISGRPFRIIKQELDFYRKHNISLPRRHPDIRHEERMKLRPGRTLHLRTCDKTGEEIISVYPADYPGKVYSEQAYQQEIFG